MGSGHISLRGVTLEEAVDAVANSLREADRQREEYYRQQQLASSAQIKTWGGESVYDYVSNYVDWHGLNNKFDYDAMVEDLRLKNPRASDAEIREAIDKALTRISGLSPEEIHSSANNGYFLHVQSETGNVCSVRLGGSSFPPNQNKKILNFIESHRRAGTYSFSFWVSSSPDVDRSNIKEDLGKGDSAYFSQRVWSRVLNYFA